MNRLSQLKISYVYLVYSSANCRLPTVCSLKLIKHKYKEGDAPGKASLHVMLFFFVLQHVVHHVYIRDGYSLPIFLAPPVYVRIIANRLFVRISRKTCNYFSPRNSGLKFIYLFSEWKRGLYELVSNGVRGNVKKENAIAALAELAVSNYGFILQESFGWPFFGQNAVLVKEFFFPGHRRGCIVRDSRYIHAGRYREPKRRKKQLLLHR